jgi:hypothetical protein
MNMYPLMMEDCPQDLQCKLQNAKGDLAKRRYHFLELARHDSEWFGYYQPLAYLITEDDIFRKLTRDMFMRFVDSVPEAELSQEAQYHTHVTSATLGRMAALYDWTVEMQLLNTLEQKAISSAILDHAHKFAMQQLHGRTVTGFDNQVMSHAFCCVAVGYVLGQKRGSDPLAQRMLGLGLAWLRELFSLIPKGAYSLEGSTYNEQVAVPVALWSTIIYEQITGQEIFFSGCPKGCPSIHSMLDMLCKSVGSGGLMPPWDSYGWQRFSVRMLLVYLAKRTGNPNPLRMIRDLNAWRILDHPAWECDDRMWSLTWWPEGLDDTAAPLYDAWLEPLTAGALQERKNRIRLFQFWDQTEGMPHCGRPEVNSNAIAFEAFGTPLLFDGVGKLDEKLLPKPVAAIREYADEIVAGLLRGATDEDSISAAAKQAVSGSIGLSNSLVFDDEFWYAPKHPVHGNGLSLHSAGPLQVIISEASDYYRDRYDVRELRRISALVDGRYAVTLDQVRADSDHKVSWQVFAAPNTKVVEGGADAVTHDGVGLRILSENGVLPLLDSAPNFPSHCSWRGSTRVRFQGRTESGIYNRAFCMFPYESLKPITGKDDELNNDWTLCVGGIKLNVPDLSEAVILDPCVSPDKPRIFTKTVQLKNVPQKVFLRIPFASQSTVCRINGQEAPHIFSPPPERFERETGPSSGARHIFDLSGLLVPGSNKMELETSFFHGETLAGPIELLEPANEVPEIRFNKNGANAYQVLHEGKREDLLLLDNISGETRFAGGLTDARHALLTASDELSLMRATRSTGIGGLTLQSIKPVDIALRTHHTGVVEVVWDKIQDGDSVVLQKDDVTLRLQTEGCLSASFDSKSGAKWILRVRSSDPRFILVNGEMRGWLKPDLWIEESLSSETGESTDILPESSCYKFAGASDEDALIKQVLKGPWAVSLAAVDALSLTGSKKAGLFLLEMLKNELAQQPDPRLTHWWRSSKMLHAPGKFTPDTENDTDQARKQWRLRRALVHTLGCIGYRDAIPTLIGMLKNGKEYYTLSAQVPVALARLEAVESLSELEAQWHHPESNTMTAIRAAARYLRREIDRNTFEKIVGPG